MKLSNFLAVKTAISVVSGLSLAFLPGIYLAMFGVALDPAGIFIARLEGVSLLGIGLVCWFARNFNAGAQQDMALALFIADTLGFVFSLQAQLSGLTNTIGWVNVLFWLLLALGLGYFRFLKAEAARPATAPR